MKILIVFLLYSSIAYCMDNQNSLVEKMEEARKGNSEFLSIDHGNDPFSRFRRKYLENLQSFITNENNEISITFKWNKIVSSKKPKRLLREKLPDDDQEPFEEEVSKLLCKRSTQETDSELIIKLTLVQDSVNTDNQK